jgi:hypothetical protein
LERAEAELELLREAVARLAEGFAELPPHGEEGELDDMRDVLLRVAERLHDNYPYEHPSLRRADAQATSRDRAPGVSARDVDQPQQPRAGWRAGEQRDGERGGGADRSDVWDGGASRDI